MPKNTYIPTKGPFGCFKQAIESGQNPKKNHKDFREREREIPIDFWRFSNKNTLNVKEICEVFRSQKLRWEG